MAERLSIDDLQKLKVADLKKALKERGLALTGAKSELLERLTTAVMQESGEVMDYEDDMLLYNTDDVENSNADSMLDENVELTEPVVTMKVVKPTPVVIEAPAVAAPVAEDIEPEDTEKTEVSVAKVTTGTSEAERLKKRAERFGVKNKETMLQARAERFGVPVTSPTASSKLSTAGTGTDVDVLKKRAERFGQVVSSSLSKVDEEDKIRKRKERFGDVTASTNNTTKIKLNQSPEVDEKKRKRAERFGLS